MCILCVCKVWKRRYKNDTLLLLLLLRLLLRIASSCFVFLLLLSSSSSSFFSMYTTCHHHFILRSHDNHICCSYPGLLFCPLWLCRITKCSIQLAALCNSFQFNKSLEDVVSQLSTKAAGAITSCCIVSRLSSFFTDFLSCKKSSHVKIWFDIKVYSLSGSELFRQIVHVHGHVVKWTGPASVSVKSKEDMHSL